ncbi:Aste57867_13023 [Aphanomyces stellatus]|uniref:Aste57867_13023 protein n=1 Tax=Aphanomyces stellatus TaxID=120398 RepID=A0A485KX43_9STRA|nr:hypothetical protein As57867_012975 [Aphanomyces stellatus]VFT89868.1 Aste57867_13023 [Aphanomyces stellatus]
MARPHPLAEFKVQLVHKIDNKLIALRKRISLVVLPGALTLSHQTTLRPHEVSHKGQLLKIYFEGCRETMIRFSTGDELRQCVGFIHEAFPDLRFEMSRPCPQPHSATSAPTTMDHLARAYMQDDTFRASVHRIHCWLDSQPNTCKDNTYL